MKNLNVFSTVSEYNSAKTSGQLDLPNASLVNEDNSIHYEMDSQQDSLPEYVDLGLPSGLKWATCNLGASSFEQTGKYYAWGETTGYTGEQIESNVRTFTSNEYTTNDLPKPASDFIGTLDAEYDAATKELGSNWRMPTSDEYQELLDGTTQEWITSYHGIDGYIIRSNKNSNTIFLPAAGFASEGLCYMGVYCNYSTSVSINHDTRIVLEQYDSLSMNNGCGRSLGISIRPVYVGE